MDQKMTVFSTNEQSIQLDVNELPNIISGLTQQMNDYSVKIKFAEDNAKSAKKCADDASNMSAGLGKKKSAIEALQSAESSLANAVVSGTELQLIAFECQNKLADISKFLFGLGVSNLALNRSVVRELELKLSGASAVELSDLAKQETINVIRQLKAQEDILIKQEQLDNKIKIVHDENARQDKQLEEQIETDKRHFKELQAHAIVDKQLAKELKARVEIDKRHGDELRSQAEADSRLAEELKVQVEVDKRHDDELRSQAEADLRLAEELRVQVEADKRHDDELRSQAEADLRFAQELKSQVETDRQHNELLASLVKHDIEHDKALEDIKNELKLSLAAINKKLIVSYLVGGAGVLISVIALLLTL